MKTITCRTLAGAAALPLLPVLALAMPADPAVSAYERSFEGHVRSGVSGYGKTRLRTLGVP